jgi:class 3 adenylate cyclase
MSLDRVLCSSCGFGNPEDARFCGGCASRLSAGSSPALGSAASYTPAHLAQRILAARSAIEGERKLVTVMFADIRGSFEMIADRDPEQAQAILDELLRTMIDAVHRYDGTVNQVLGDGLMALFGAPIAHEDHAFRAASAALAIRDAVRGARMPSAVGSESPDVRIGLNSGLVVITAIDNDLSVEYRAVGATTHLASRMEQIAPAGGIRLTRDTLRLAEGLIEVESVGRIAVKGVRDPVEVFELKRIAPSGTRFGSRVARGLTPLVGRAVELELLSGALRAAQNGEPRVIALDGEPGVGKSRLCHELMRSGAARECRALAVAASSHDRTTAYAPIAALLRGAFEVSHAEDTEPARLRIERQVSPELHEHLPVLLDLLHLSPAAAAPDHLEPAQRKRRISEAVRAFVRWVGSTGCALLVFEDLQWFDAETLELLEGIASDPPARNLLLILTSRTALPRAWAPFLSAQRRVLPLAPDLAGELVESLLGAHPASKSLREQLIQRTAGNPLFLEEIVRTLFDARELVGEAGSLAPREPLAAPEIPASVQALFAARIDRTAAGVKALVQTAAVVGSEMSLELLGAVTRLAGGELRAQLAGAVDAGLLVETPHFPGSRCAFVHAIAHEVALGTVLHSQRTQLHVRVVEALEALHPDRVVEQIERLAEHSHAGELWQKSARYSLLAAGRAANRFANRDAVAQVERGLNAVERMPSGAARAEAAIDLRLAGLAALVPLGEQERVVATLFEAEALAASLDDTRRQNAIRSQLSNAL